MWSHSGFSQVQVTSHPQEEPYSTVSLLFLGFQVRIPIRIVGNFKVSCHSLPRPHTRVWVHMFLLRCTLYLSLQLSDHQTLAPGAGSPVLFTGDATVSEQARPAGLKADTGQGKEVVSQAESSLLVELPADVHSRDGQPWTQG